MSLRFKLLLLSLLTLFLPWAGWRYALQMEATIRGGQEQALLTTAQVLSQVVASEAQDLYRVPDLRVAFDPERGDVFAPLLPTEPLIDGFPDEWPPPRRPVPGFDEGSKLRLGVYRRYMYLYAEVADSNVRYENPAAPELRAGADADRLVVLTRDTQDNRERAWSITAVAPGPIVVRASDIGSPWKPLPEEVPYVSGIWRQTSTGYVVELRGPVNHFGTQIAVFPIDREQGSAPAVSLAWLHTASESLKQKLEQYTPTGLRVSVIDLHGWLLARAGSIATDTHSTDYPGLRRDEYGFVHSIYRELFGDTGAPAKAYGIPYGMWGAPVDEARAGNAKAMWFQGAGGEPSLVRAAFPIRYGETDYGALVVEQPDEELAEIQELALTRLINLTLFATLIAITVTLAYALRLSHRIRRLSRAASTALTPEGRIEPRIPDTGARDELGALARSYDTLLGRLKEYTAYLQTLGTKLSHELRTPLTIVSSSLENLGSEEKLPPAAQAYLERARSGANRMHALLTAMTEATRVEQSIEHTERGRFDLAELVKNMGQAYRATFERHRIETRTPSTPCTLEGSPDLIAQLLDKLMDNARDFCPEGGTITLAVEAGGRGYRLSVSNEGPPLPRELSGRLFESLVTSRDGSTNGRPHLGLGLYIVRLITDFHRGTVTAANLTDGAGVIISVELPRFP